MLPDFSSHASRAMQPPLSTKLIPSVASHIFTLTHTVVEADQAQASLKFAAEKSISAKRLQSNFAVRQWTTISIFADSGIISRCKQKEKRCFFIQASCMGIK